MTTNIGSYENKDYICGCHNKQNKRTMKKALIIALCAAGAMIATSCASRPDSPYYIDKSTATNKYEKKVIKTYNKLVENYTNVVNEPQNNLSNSDITKYEKNLKKFAAATKTAAEKRRVGLNLIKELGKNSILLGKDFLEKFKEFMPSNPDFLKIPESLKNL